MRSRDADLELFSTALAGLIDLLRRYQAEVRNYLGDYSHTHTTGAIVCCPALANVDEEVLDAIAAWDEGLALRAHRGANEPNTRELD